MRFAHLRGKSPGRARAGTWDFLRQRTFWLLAGCFLRDVLGGRGDHWLVSYYRGAGILTGEGERLYGDVIWAYASDAPDDCVSASAHAGIADDGGDFAVCNAAYAGDVGLADSATSLAMLAVSACASRARIPRW
jgi:hypothetical protein